MLRIPKVQIAFVVHFTPSNLEVYSREPTWLNLGMNSAAGFSRSPTLTFLSSSTPSIFHACAEMDVQRGGIREHEARKPVVLMFSPWSFDLASRQLSLISVFVDDY